MHGPRARRLDNLLRPVARDLARFALGITRDEAVADDLLQEALVTALRKLDQLQDDRAFRGWMHRILWRTWLSRRPARPEAWTVTWTDVDARQRSAAVPGPEDRLLARRLGEALADAFARLPEGQRAAVELVDGQGLTFAEAADVLGVPPGTVASRVARARHALRGDLAGLARAEGVTR